MMKIKEKFSSEISILSHAVTIEGNLSGEGDFRIDGKVLGKLNIKGNITLGEHSFIKGEITAQNLNLSGKIEGNIFVNEKLTLEKTSVMSGNITTKQLIVEPGAIINGHCSMSEKNAVLTTNAKV